METRPGSSGAEGIANRLREWRQGHAGATFDEIEDAVQRELAGWQARLVEELLAGTPTGTEAVAGEAPPVCAACGSRMQRCGTRVRRLVSRMGQAIALERAYYVCPACGSGLFPPG